MRHYVARDDAVQNVWTTDYYLIVAFFEELVCFEGTSSSLYNFNVRIINSLLHGVVMALLFLKYNDCLLSIFIQLTCVRITGSFSKNCLYSMCINNFHLIFLGVEK